MDTTIPTGVANANDVSSDAVPIRSPPSAASYSITARTRNLYSIPLVSPDTENDVVPASLPGTRVQLPQLPAPAFCWYS